MRDPNSTEFCERNKAKSEKELHDTQQIGMKDEMTVGIGKTVRVRKIKTPNKKKKMIMHINGVVSRRKH